MFLRVLVTPEVQKTTPGGPGAALDHPPLAGLNGFDQVFREKVSGASILEQAFQ